MNKIIAILGLSCAGKDTIIEKLSYETKIPIIVPHTTRPMREHELNELQYNFVSDNFFEENKERFIEQRIYKVKNKNNSTSIWRYGIHEDSVQEGINLVIVDPPGLKDLIKYYGKENIIPFYIFATDETRMDRLKKRGDFNNPMEVKRRFNDDNERFKEFIQSKDYYKICNDSNDINLAVQEIKGILKNYCSICH